VSGAIALNFANMSTDASLRDGVSPDLLRILDEDPDVVLAARLSLPQLELRVFYVNRAGERILGRPAAQILGLPVRELMRESAAFSTPELRGQLFEQLRKHGVIEFPGVVPVNDGRGGTRLLRLRFRWVPNEDWVLAIGEDVTERSQLEDHGKASERLRSSKDVSGLLSHHINNALTGAMLNLEWVTENALPANWDDPHDARQALREARLALSTAAQALSALATTVSLDAGVSESADLLQALREGLGNACGRAGGAVRCETDASEAVYWVWGANEQLAVILDGFIAALTESGPQALRASFRREEGSVHLQLRTDGGSDAWLRPLLDPTGVHPGPAGAHVRLFASSQMLHAIGGDLGLPRSSGGVLGIELTFRAAPGQVTDTGRPAPLLMVTRNNSLRVFTATALAPRQVEFSTQAREGIVRAMRPGRGLAICDVDELGISAEDLTLFHRMASGPSNRRLWIASRHAPFGPEVDLPQLHIPFEAAELRALLDAYEREG
jgi:hypothetical protein